MAQGAAADEVIAVHHPMLVLVTVLTATFVQLVDISIVNVAIPSIQANLHASFSAVQLVIAGYQLAFACTLITAARLGDIFGRKRLFLLGMTGFTIASAICGAATTPTMLVLSRVLQGVMSGLMFPQVLSVIQVTFPPKERGRAFGIFGATIGLATILGPLLGGVLIQLNIAHLTWRTIFYVNLPIGIFAVVAAIKFLPESRAPKASKLDVLGAIIVASGLFLLVSPLTEGREKGWPAWTFVMLGLSVPVLVAFALLERSKTRRDDSPLLLTTLFGDRAFNAGLALSAVFFLGVAPFFFLFSLYLQLGHGFTALGAGLTTFPFAVGSAAAASQSDRIAQRLGRRILRLGTGTLVVGMVALLLAVQVAGVRLHSYQLWLPLLVCGIGLGLFIGPVSNVILAGVRREAAGSASGVLSTAQLVAGAIGVAVLGAIAFSLLGHNAAASTRPAVARLQADLAAAHVPPTVSSGLVRTFTDCFAAHARARDPQASVSVLEQGQRVTCPNPSSAPAGPVRAAFVRAAASSQSRDFTSSEKYGIGWEIAVFAIAFLLVGRLPDVKLGDHPPAAGTP